MKIRITHLLPISCLAGLVFCSLISCKKEETKTVITVPVLAPTQGVTTIAPTTAVTGGNVTSDGGSAVTARGVCYGKVTSPTIATDSVTSNGSGSGSFVSSLSLLEPGTKYFVRSYATNSKGTAYGQEVSFATLQEPNTVTDIDGNVYQTVKIGTQTWLAENLKVSKYRNGDPIPTGLTNGEWGNTTSGAYSVYNDKDSNNTKYGKLYNWYTSVDPRGLCPIGWHVPTDVEWSTLEIYLENNGYNYDGSVDTDQDRYTNNKIGKALATSTGWKSSSDQGNVGNSDYPLYQNKSGFSGLPGGNRDNNGNYTYISGGGIWWSSTLNSAEDALSRGLFYYLGNSARYTFYKQFGLSVRCIRD